MQELETLEARKPRGKTRSRRDREVLRCDRLPHAMNAGKAAKVKELLVAWRRAAALVANEQWGSFFRDGRGFKKNQLAAHEAAVDVLVDAKRLVGAQRLQMVRYQAVGVLESWLANRQNGFARIVQRSTLSETTRHQLNSINRRRLWFVRQDVVVSMTDGTVIPDEVRHLARCIMRHLLQRHEKPCWARIGMVIDRRQVTIAKATRAQSFAYWVRLQTLAGPVQIPLQSYPHHEARGGTLATTLQVSERPGSTGNELVFGLVSDMAEVFTASKEDYVPRSERLALDFGLDVLFATDRGDLLGRGFLASLQRYDRRIQQLLAHLQPRGIKPGQSVSYRRLVQSLRGLIASAVGRVLNRLVDIHAPAELVLERLGFQRPGLSRRLNRLLQNCGRSVIRQKLADLEERYGITSSEVNPAYTSQTCSSCGYVAKNNRKTRNQFSCRFCGHEVHADMNGARNIALRSTGGRRSSAGQASGYLTKAQVLEMTVRRHLERFPKTTGSRARAADPRLKNPYFREFLGTVRSMFNSHSGAQTPDLGAVVRSG